ncbi:TPA: ABC transporter permease [Streptococcus suis]
MKALLLVAKETYLRQVKSWSFVFMVLSPFLFLGLSLGSAYLTSSSMNAGSEKIGLVSEDFMAHMAFATLDLDLVLVTEEEAKQQLSEEELAGYIKVAVVDQQYQATYHGKEVPSQSVQQTFQSILESLQQQLNEANAQLTPTQLEVLAIQPSYVEEVGDQEGLEKIGQMITFFGLIFLMYIMTIVYASTTAQEVASEKGTKIMEVIFSSVPAWTYFYGRIFGIFLVIATHLGVYLVGGILAYHLAGQLELTKEIFESNQVLVQAVFDNLDWTMILFAIFGLLLGVTLASLCGSLVVRPEDVNKAVQPVIYPIIIGFLGGMTFGQQAQEHMVVKIGSFIPFLSSFFMPIRQINGWASSWETWLSFFILAATTIGAIVFIGKSYAGLILQTDDIGFWRSLKKGLTSK